MSARRRIAGIIGAVILGLGIAVAVEAPASAHGEACGPTHICVWYAAWPGGGNPAYYWTSPASSQCIPFGPAINDQIGSMKLTWGWSATIYENAGCSGTAIATVYQGQFKNCTQSGWAGAWFGSCFPPGNSGSSIWFQHPTN